MTSDIESEDSTNSESGKFWNLVLGAAQISQVYVDKYLVKNPPKDISP